MKNSFKFFQNKECKYFPCHKVLNEDSFNCLFCYCPLYFLEECGGNKSMYKGIKDCSSCMIPHKEKGYDVILKKIAEENKREKLLSNIKGSFYCLLCYLNPNI